MRRWLEVGALGSIACAGVAAADGAVVFMYHHVDRETPAATSVAPAQFAAQLEHLEREGFAVLPLLAVLDALRHGRGLPPKAVALTFDDGYSSVLSQALPELERRGWPFTVFVSTQPADHAYGGYLTWEQLRELRAAGATFGNHTRTHAHLVRRLNDESSQQWRARVTTEIRGAQERLIAELDSAVIPVLAYPYGEYTADLKTVVSELGLYAMGQHSGALGADTDWLAAPRFPVATGFDSLDEFAARAIARALPVRESGAEKHVLAGDESSPPLRLTLGGGDFRRAELACYASNQGRMRLEWLDVERGLFEIRPNRPLAPGRTKYNCTAPSASEAGVYYWHSHLWMKRNADGTWYSE